MRTVFFLAAALAFAGCSANRGSKLIDSPAQPQTIRVPDAYPTKMGTAEGPIIGSNSPLPGEPSARRTTVRR
jgi:hypothetical protein